MARAAYRHQEFLSAYSGVRTRFQRLSDCRFFTGWVQDVYGDRLQVRAHPETLLAMRQSFHFELFGPDNIAAFQAVLQNSSGMEVYRAGISPEELQLRKKIATASESVFEFQLTTVVILRNTDEEARTLTRAARVLVRTFEGESSGTMVDASPNGIGVLLDTKLQNSEAVQLQIQTHHGEIACGGQVRYCRPDALIPGSFRAGIRITLMERVDRARWQRIRN